MANLRIHADFDHDGKITRSLKEHDLRQKPPGVIIVPNLDLDGVKSSSSIGKKIKEKKRLDYEKSIKISGDDELVSFEIETDLSLVNNKNNSFFLLIGGISLDAIKVYDSKKKPITPQNTFVGDKSIKLASGTKFHKFYLEATTFAGSPLFDVFPDRTNKKKAEAFTFKIRVICQDSNKMIIAQDWAFFSLAPLIFAGNQNPATRLYMAEIKAVKHQVDGNYPALQEIRQAIKKVSGLKFMKIPEKLNRGDAWIQDQFQLGFCASPSNFSKVILHLPRSRSNFTPTSLNPNLSFFVKNHFPALNVALVQDFWNRNIARYENGQGKIRLLKLEESYHVYLVFNRFWNLMYHMEELLRYELGLAYYGKGVSLLFIKMKNESISKARSLLDSVFKLVIKELDEIKNSSTLSDPKKRYIEWQKQKFEKQKKLIEASFSITAQGKVEIKTSNMHKMLFSTKVADKLDTELGSLHSSQNYGGNFEVSPEFVRYSRFAHPDGSILIQANHYPFGKIVLGSPFMMDDKLRKFILDQKCQPFVSLDISWLKVGHIDEILSFIPNKSGQAPFGIVVASPGIAVEILGAAWKFYKKKADPPRETVTDTRRFNLNHSWFHGVTSLLRGKHWVHHHPEEAFIPHEPPRIHQRLSREVFEVEYIPGAGDDRYYDAMITVQELLYSDYGIRTSCWIAIEKEHQWRERLEEEFPKIPMISLPVLFDDVPWKKITLEEANDKAESLRKDKFSYCFKHLMLFDGTSKRYKLKSPQIPDFDTYSTEAFTPNMANLQVINDLLLIPKPFGPRMNPKDAIDVLKSIMEKEHHSKLNTTYFKKNKLDKNFIWVKHSDAKDKKSDLEWLYIQFRGGFQDLFNVIGEFSFESDKEFKKKIIAANKNTFDSHDNLKPGWHRILIPENTVDLFETYTTVMLDALGIEIHFIDTWYYHIRSGEIHCGTNVVREPKDIRKYKKWWYNTESFQTIPKDLA